jgi:hypothetical protein
MIRMCLRSNRGKVRIRIIPSLHRSNGRRLRSLECKPSQSFVEGRAKEDSKAYMRAPWRIKSWVSWVGAAIKADASKMDLRCKHDEILDARGAA